MARKYSSRDLVLSELPPNLIGQVYGTTTLNGALNATATSVTVASLAGNFGHVGDLLIDNEYIYFTGTSASGTQYTPCTRGAWNSTAGTHADGVMVYNAYLDRRIESMSAYVDTVLSQRYQGFPGYSATGSCPEMIEYITRNLVAHEALVRTGLMRSMNEEAVVPARYKEVKALLGELKDGKIEIPVQTGTQSLTFGTDNTGTLPWSTDKAPLSGHKAILPETVVVTDSGTTYVNGDDYRIFWDESRQSWVLSRYDSSEIRDGGTATYEYSWLKSWFGKTEINKQKTRVTNIGRIIRGA